MFVNTFHQWLKHYHRALSVFPEVIWQLSANHLHQMLFFSRYPTRAVVVLSEKNYTFGMNCTVTLMKIVSKYWKIWTDHGVYNIKCSFKITLHSFPLCFIFDAKYSSLLNLATVKICPWQKQSVSGITCLS